MRFFSFEKCTTLPLSEKRLTESLLVNIVDEIFIVIIRKKINKENLNSTKKIRARATTTTPRTRKQDVSVSAMRDTQIADIRISHINNSQRTEAHTLSRTHTEGIRDILSSLCEV